LRRSRRRSRAGSGSRRSANCPDEAERGSALDAGSRCSGILRCVQMKPTQLVMTAGHEFYKKLTCPNAEHVVRSVDGGEAYCTLNNPSPKHQIEFDWWLAGVFR
jgi:hypothetical protein